MTHMRTHTLQKINENAADMSVPHSSRSSSGSSGGSSSSSSDDRELLPQELESYRMMIIIPRFWLSFHFL